MNHDTIIEFLNLLGHEVALVGRSTKVRTIWPEQIQNDGLLWALEELEDCPSIYVQLNPLLPQFHAAQPPHISVQNKMIARRTHLLIDIDGHDVPKDEAERQKNEIKQYLNWPVLLETDSGRGYGLIYQFNSPNDLESRNRVREFLESLKRIFPCVDSSVFSAKQLTRCIGTLNHHIETRIINGNYRRIAG